MFTVQYVSTLLSRENHWFSANSNHRLSGSKNWFRPSIAGALEMGCCNCCGFKTVLAGHLATVPRSGSNASADIQAIILGQAFAGDGNTCWRSATEAIGGTLAGVDAFSRYKS